MFSVKPPKAAASALGLRSGFESLWAVKPRKAAASAQNLAGKVGLRGTALAGCAYPTMQASRHQVHESAAKGEGTMGRGRGRTESWWKMNGRKQ